MSFYQWIYFCTIGSLEFILIGKFLFGLRKRNLMWRISAVFLAGTVGYLCHLVEISEIYTEFKNFHQMAKITYGYLCHLVEISEIYTEFIWITILLLLYFQRVYVRHVVLTFFCIQIIDNLIWSMMYVFPVSDASELGSDFYILLAGAIGFVILCVVCRLIQKKQWKVAEFFSDLSKKEISLFCVGLFTILSLFAFVQGFYLEEMTPTLKRISVFFCILVVIIMLIIFFYLENTVQKKRYLEKISEVNRNYLHAQTQYIEQSKARYEQLKGFRHDVKQHFQVLELLASQKQYEKIEEYIQKIQDEKILKTMNITGNVIADSLIMDVFGENMEKADWNFSFLGKFDEEIPIDEMSLCVLLSNGFRNAKEALETCGDKVFRLEIKQDEKELCIFMENSISNPDTDITKTGKEDAENHGYGIRNMKKVVEENKGTISWDVHGKRMRVSIYFPM